MIVGEGVLKYSKKEVFTTKYLNYGRRFEKSNRGILLKLEKRLFAIILNSESISDEVRRKNEVEVFWCFDTH